MLRIKLSRRGKKNQPVYRLLVIEREKDPYGTYIENVGTYNPRIEPNALELKEDRIKYWISVGAQPTDTVHNLLVGAGVISDKKRSVSSLGKKYKEKLAEGDKKEKQPKAEEKKEEKPAEDSKPEKKKEEPKAEEAKEEKPAEESKPEEAPAEEKKGKSKAEEEKPAESLEPAEAAE